LYETPSEQNLWKFIEDNALQDFYQKILEEYELKMAQGEELEFYLQFLENDLKIPPRINSIQIIVIRSFFFFCSWDLPFAAISRKYRSFYSTVNFNSSFSAYFIFLDILRIGMAAVAFFFLRKNTFFLLSVSISISVLYLFCLLLFKPYVKFLAKIQIFFAECMNILISIFFFILAKYDSQVESSMQPTLLTSQGPARMKLGNLFYATLCNNAIF